MSAADASSADSREPTAENAAFIFTTVRRRLRTGTENTERIQRVYLHRDPETQWHNSKRIVAQIEGRRVTFWSLFRGQVTNDFEGE